MSPQLDFILTALLVNAVAPVDGSWEYFNRESNSKESADKKSNGYAEGYKPKFVDPFHGKYPDPYHEMKGRRYGASHAKNFRRHDGINHSGPQMTWWQNIWYGSNYRCRCQLGSDVKKFEFGFLALDCEQDVVSPESPETFPPYVRKSLSGCDMCDTSDRGNSLDFMDGASDAFVVVTTCGSQGWHTKPPEELFRGVVEVVGVNSDTNNFEPTYIVSGDVPDKICVEVYASEENLSSGEVGPYQKLSFRTCCPFAVGDVFGSLLITSITDTNGNTYPEEPKTVRAIGPCSTCGPELIEIL